MIKPTVKIRGVPEAILKFRRTTVKIKTRGLKQAMKSSTQPMVRATASEAPTVTGTLRRSQRVRIQSYRRGAYVLAVVGARAFRYANGRNPAKYSHLVHDGHRIATRRLVRTGPRFQWSRRRRWWGTTHRTVKGARVAGNPFALRGFRSSSSLTQYLFARSIGNEVEAAARSS